MKTIRLFFQSANLSQSGTKILVSPENKMDDGDIEDIIEEGLEQESDELISLIIDTVQEQTGEANQDIVILYGVLKSRLAGELQATLFSKLGEFYTVGLPKIKEEFAANSAGFKQHIVNSMTISEYEKQIQLLMPDDYSDEDDEIEDSDENEAESKSEKNDVPVVETEEQKRINNILIGVGAVILLIGLLFCYLILAQGEANTKEEKKAAQKKTSTSTSNSTSTNTSNKSKKKSQDVEEFDYSALEDTKDSKEEKKSESSSNNATTYNDAKTFDSAMGDLSNSQRNTIAVSFGFSEKEKISSDVILKKRQGLKLIGESIQRFSSMKHYRNFVEVWKKYYPNQRLDFDLLLLQNAYGNSSYQLEQCDWNKPVFSTADLGVIKEVNRLFSDTDLSCFANRNDAEEAAILEELSNAKSLLDLSLVFRQPKCSEMFASRMTLESLKACLDDDLNPNKKNSMISNDVFNDFREFRNKKENVNKNSRQVQEDFVKYLIRDATQESGSVYMIHREFKNIVESVKSVAD